MKITNVWICQVGEETIIPVFGDMEIDDGRFCRTLDLPDDANIEQIRATYRRGQLLVTVPKLSIL